MTAAQPDITTAILFAIRDGKFPSALTAQGYNPAERDSGLTQLERENRVVIAPPEQQQPMRGAGFTMPGTSQPTAQLTFDGERYVDQLRGVNSLQLEAAGKNALLTAMVTNPLRLSDSVAMPEGIGPHRQAFLLGELVRTKQAAATRESRQQGFFTVATDLIKITPAGALALAQAQTEPQELEAAFRSVRRQVLLRGLEADQPIAVAHEKISTNLPGWGPELFVAATQPLRDAGVVAERLQSVQQGFFTVSCPVLALTQAPVVTAAITDPLQPYRSVANLTSGERLAATLAKFPEAQIKVDLPAAKGAKAAALLL